MGSLDDIYDLVDRMDNSGLEYLLITIQKGKEKGKADIFYRLENSSSLKILIKGLNVFNEEIDKKRESGEL